jgi:hypothetical protein
LAEQRNVTSAWPPYHNGLAPGRQRVGASILDREHSRFSPDKIYGPLETTLVQFNAWLLRSYRRASP